MNERNGLNFLIPLSTLAAPAFAFGCLTGIESIIMNDSFLQRKPLCDGKDIRTIFLFYPGIFFQIFQSSGL